jgi:pimeloyl-ACP methyl ester carboxylesterase
MALDFPLRVWKGEREKPVLILIHGFGATEKSWIHPYEEYMGMGRISFDYVLTDYERRPSPPYFPQWRFRNYCLSTPLRKTSPRPPSLWECLREEGYSMMTWTQRKRYGPITLAVEELNGVVEESKALFGSDLRLVLIGHSRGGLVARKWIQDHPQKRGRIQGVALLACPNAGSRLIDVAQFFSRTSRVIGRLLPKDFSSEGKRISSPVSALHEEIERLFKGVAREELSPHSPFMLVLKKGESEEQRSGVRYLNVVGTSTAFTKLYRISPLDSGGLREVFSLIDSLRKVIPSALMPEEIVDGRGDGLVAKERARIAWIPLEFSREFPVNHLRMLIDTNVQREIIQFLEGSGR